MSPSEVQAGTDIARQPPSSPEAEQAVLGSMMLSEQAVSNALDELNDPKYFYKNAHRIIFEAISEMFEEGREIDAVTLGEKLADDDQLEEAGGSNYLAELVNSVPSVAHVAHYAEIVKKNYMHRALIDTCSDIIEMSFNRHENAEDLVDKAEKMIFSVKQDRVSEGVTAIGDIIKETFEEVDEAANREGVISGIKTGYTKFDSMTSGFQKNQLIIIAARPGMGKTSLALNMAQNIALDEEEPVVMFSMEMSNSALTKRLLASSARVSYSKLRSGKISEADWDRLANAMMRLGDAPIYLEDSANLNVLQMKAKARRLQANHGLSLAIVDYLQLMDAVGPAESNEQRLSNISRGLKQLAMELEIPVLALTQLNRQVEHRGGDKRPQLADLRGSGAIEQDADVVGFVYRPFIYTKKEEDKGYAEVILGKQRNGPTGSVPLSFIDEYMRFENMKKEPEPGGY
ncbi:MAG: replicative DNA helicase [bacterium]